MTNAEINAKVLEMKELDHFIKEMQAEMDGIKDELRAEMGDREVLSTDIFTLRNPWVTSSRFDTKAFKQVYGEEVYEQFCKPSTCRRFTYN